MAITCEANEIKIFFLAGQTYERRQSGGLFHRLSARKCHAGDALQIEPFQNLIGCQLCSCDKRYPVRRKTSVTIEWTSLNPYCSARAWSKRLGMRSNIRNVQNMTIFGFPAV